MNRGCKSAKTFEIESMTYQPMNLDTGKLFRSFWREISHFFLKVTLFTVLCEMKIWQKRKRITDYHFPRQHNRRQMQMALKTRGKSRTGLPPSFYTWKTEIRENLFWYPADHRLGITFFVTATWSGIFSLVPLSPFPILRLSVPATERLSLFST